MRKNHYKLRGYISTNRSKHNLKAHLILVCKYRKKLLQDSLNDSIKVVIDEIAEQNDFTIIAMESDIDHIHLMIQYLPRVSISLIIRIIKQVTTYKIWREIDLLYTYKGIFGKKRHFGVMDFLLVLLVKQIKRL